ncbi:MAG: hypothetical protein JXB07_06450 [Anaerolineae bacterium]|nr:hypothetical protein [Anaerolineae bacterium]
MSEIVTPTPKRQGSALLGMILLCLGIVFLLMEVTGFRLAGSFWAFVWPFFVITPGALLLFLGTREGGKMSEAASVIGGIVTMTGLLLFYQNTTGHWESWAYVWALTMPGGIAVGYIVDGVINNRPERKSSGWKLLTISLIMFGVGAVFFEVVLDISGFFRSSGLGKIALPALLIGLGLLLMTGSLGGRKEVPAVKKDDAPSLK